MPGSSSAPRLAAGNSCLPTPISRSICRRCASSSTASESPISGSIWPTSGRQLGILVAGNYVNRFTRDGRAYKVIPQVGKDARGRGVEPARLQDPHARRQAGGDLVARDAGDVHGAAHAGALPADRQLPRLRRRQTRSDQRPRRWTTLEAAAQNILPAGYTIDYAGESRQIRQEGTTLAGTLGFAILLIYLVLAAQFGSFRDPLVVLLGSVPLALSAALVFTFFGFTTINIYSQIGLITLVGLIAKNGILIVAFANELQIEGADQAGGDPRGGA